MVDHSQLEAHLSGWKAIAAHLKVSVRTAQNLGKNQGLPVLRHGVGPKAPVSADVGDLTAWTASRTPSTKNRPESEQGVTSAAVKVLHRRRWVAYTLSGAATVIAACFFVPNLSRRRRPGGFRIGGSALRILDDDDAEIWRHTFPNPIREDAFRAVMNAGPLCRLEDVDGDGRLEALFWYLPDNLEGSLICFDDVGKKLWDFVPGKTVTDNFSKQYARPYLASAFKVIRAQSWPNPRVIVTSFHHVSFPNQVAVLDGRTGKLISEYWHRGHLRHIEAAELNGGPTPLVLLGGVNDAPEYKQATMLAFDRGQISGVCRNPNGAPYFQSMAPGTETVRIFFPRTPVGAGKEFNIVSHVRVNDGRITVMVVESIIEPDTTYVVYELDHSFKILNVTLSDTFQENYSRLQLSGKVRNESMNTVADRLGQAVIIERNG
jgi:hypothetical protein